MFRFLRHIAIALLLAQWPRQAAANVEKAVFVAPDTSTMPNASPNLDSLCLESLAPPAPKLHKLLPVRFPSKQHPQGRQSWYLLKSLRPGKRYEVRICWATTQPTAFRLATHTISDAFNDEHLITHLGSYSEERQSGSCEPQAAAYSADRAGQTSLLFLVIDAAADFHSSNKTLMSSPPDVEVDIILDPYILGLLPRSLGPTAVYVTCVAFVAYFLSGYIYAWIRKPTMTKKDTKKKSKVS